MNTKLIQIKDFGNYSIYIYSAGFYLINRERLKPIINAIITIDPLYPNTTQFKIIAGHTTTTNNRQCFPPECCPTYTNRSLACIHSPHAVADNYVYNILPTYVSKLPLAMPDLKRDIISTDTTHDLVKLLLPLSLYLYPPRI